MAIERKSAAPRGRTNYTTIPDGDYRKEWAIVLYLVHAAAEESGTWDDEQRRGMNEVVTPALEAVRDVDDKRNMRGLLAIRINEAKAAFYRVMGEQWAPRPDNTVRRQAEAKGLEL